MDLHFLSRLGIFVTAILSIIVAVNTFSFETINSTSLIALSTAAGSCFALLKLIHSDVQYRFNKKIEADKKLFGEFMKLLPSDEDPIYLLRHHEFGATFERSRLKNLGVFLHKWDVPGKTFHNKKMENLNSQLYDAAVKLNGLISLTHFCTGGTTFLSLFPDLKYTKRDFWKEKQREVNDQATNFYTTYEKFIKISKNELGL